MTSTKLPVQVQHLASQQTSIIKHGRPHSRKPLALELWTSTKFSPQQAADFTCHSGRTTLSHLMLSLSLIGWTITGGGTHLAEQPLTLLLHWLKCMSWWLDCESNQQALQALIRRQHLCFLHLPVHQAVYIHSDTIAHLVTSLYYHKTSVLCVQPTCTVHDCRRTGTVLQACCTVYIQYCRPTCHGLQLRDTGKRHLLAWQCFHLAMVPTPATELLQFARKVLGACSLAGLACGLGSEGGKEKLSTGELRGCRLPL